MQVVSVFSFCELIQRTQMDQGHSDLNAFNVRWIEALSSQPYWHQNDDRIPGLVGGIRGCLAQ